MPGNTLFSIGEALIDMIPSRVGCTFDEVPSFSPRTGGAPANVCAAFARLGGASSFLTQLGDDPFGHKIARGAGSLRHRPEPSGVHRQGQHRPCAS